jgi:hypothetical protein
VEEPHHKSARKLNWLLSKAQQSSKLAPVQMSSRAID